MPREQPRQRPREQLLLVMLGALASLAALMVVRPELTPGVWSRGDDLALAVAWLVAVAASAWLFVVTGACALALGIARPALARRLAPALPVGVRRLVELAVVGSCIAFPALPAGATGIPRVPVIVVRDQPVVRAPAAAAPVSATPKPTSAPTPKPTRPRTPAPVAARVVVRPGDNLWLIARTALTNSSGGAPTETEIARYWRALISANRATLRSGNPSLVFPGEIVTVPPPTAVS